MKFASTFGGLAFPEDSPACNATEGNAGMDKPQRIKIPFTCPRCGESGAIRVNKLDRSIRCKICDTVFHVDRRLEVAVGSPQPEPPPYQIRAGAHFRGDLSPRWVRRLRRWMTPARSAASVAVTVIACLLAWLSWLHLDRSSLPTTLSGRLKIFAENWVENDIQEIRRLTDPQLTQFVDSWWKLSKRSLGGIKHIDGLEATILFENRREKIATAAISAAGDSSRDGALILFWKLQPDGTWLFDPKASIRDSGRRDVL
jgi:hypothetical protein